MIKATHTHTSAVMVDVDIVLGSSRSKDSHKSRENTVFTRNVSQFEREILDTNKAVLTGTRCQFSLDIAQTVASSPPFPGGGILNQPA